MRAIVFDLDGTLLELTREHRAVLADAFRAVTGEAREAWLGSYEAAFDELLADCAPESVERAFAESGCDGDPEEFATALLEAEIEASEPPAGAYGDLERLAGEHALGVLTNGLGDWQRAKLEAHDLEQRFDAVVVSCEVGAHKPAAAPFRELERRLGADECAMVGDSDSDIEGATRVGWTARRYRGGGFAGLPGALDW